MTAPEDEERTRRDAARQQDADGEGFRWAGVGDLGVEHRIVTGDGDEEAERRHRAQEDTAHGAPPGHVNSSTYATLSGTDQRRADVIAETLRRVGAYDGSDTDALTDAVDIALALKAYDIEQTGDVGRFIHNESFTIENHPAGPRPRCAVHGYTYIDELDERFSVRWVCRWSTNGYADPPVCPHGLIDDGSPDALGFLPDGSGGWDQTRRRGFSMQLNDGRVLSDDDLHRQLDVDVEPLESDGRVTGIPDMPIEQFVTGINERAVAYGRNRQRRRRRNLLAAVAVGVAGGVVLAKWRRR